MLENAYGACLSQIKTLHFLHVWKHALTDSNVSNFPFSKTANITEKKKKKNEKKMGQIDDFSIASKSLTSILMVVYRNIVVSCAK